MREFMALAAGVFAIAGATYAYTSLLHVSNAATVSTTYLLVVLVVSAVSTFKVAATISFAAVLAFNYFFLPPVGTFVIADPQNWTALIAFLAVSLVASNLSAVARARTAEVRARRDELARLFDLSRDVLLTTEGRDAIGGLARSIARRFDLPYVALALPRGSSWELFEGGPLAITLDQSQLSLAFAGAQSGLEFDAAERTYSGHRDDDGRRTLGAPGPVARWHQGDRPAARPPDGRSSPGRSMPWAPWSRSGSSARRCSTNERLPRLRGAAMSSRRR